MFSQLLTDIRYAARGFARRPAFAIVIVLTLAFGVGVNVAIFSVFEQLLLRPLPVSDPYRLVILGSTEEASTARMGACNQTGPCSAAFNYPMFRDLERQQEPFVGIAAHRQIRADVSLDGRAVTGSGTLVSGSYFPLLGISPAAGRLLGPLDDAVEGEARSAVLSHDYWQSAFGRDPAVIGRTILVNGKPLTVVGVTPRGFGGTTIGTAPNVYVPISFKWSDRDAVPNYTDRRAYWVYLFARLKPGLSTQAAETALNATHRSILESVELPLITDAAAEELARFRARTLQLEPGARGQSLTPARTRTPLTIMLATTAVVLLIACANIAGLLLARGATRTGEIAIRASLGAGRGRLVALLVVESLLLALAAAAVSLPLALGTLRGLAALLPSTQTTGVSLDLSLGAVAAAAAIATLSTLLFGLLPAFTLSHTDPARVLQANGARSTGSKTVARFRVALATTQVALAMTLLVVAGLFSRSLVQIARVDLGLTVESVATFELSPELVGYRPERSAELFDRLEEELGAAPGVSAVGASGGAVLSGNSSRTNVSIEGFEGDDLVQRGHFRGDFLSALNIPLLAGRAFDRGDSVGRPKVAIVNRRFVEHFGLGENAVGTRFGLDDDEPRDVEIVGVIPDARLVNAKTPATPRFLLPLRQEDPPAGTATFYVRGSGDPEQLLTAIRSVVERLDANLPVTKLRTLESQVRENVFRDRFLATLSGALATLASVLAALGLYGVLSYTVAARTREIGLRLALGAAPARLRGMVMRELAKIGLVGGAVGLAAALLLGRAAASLLFGVEFKDPLVIAGAGAALIAVTLAAGFLPARRASRIDPMVALRSD